MYFHSSHRKSDHMYELFTSDEIETIANVYIGTVFQRDLIELKPAVSTTMISRLGSFLVINPSPDDVTRICNRLFDLYDNWIPDQDHYDIFLREKFDSWGIHPHYRKILKRTMQIADKVAWDAKRHLHEITVPYVPEHNLSDYVYRSISQGKVLT